MGSLHFVGYWKSSFTTNKITKVEQKSHKQLQTTVWTKHKSPFWKRPNRTMSALLANVSCLCIFCESTLTRALVNRYQVIYIFVSLPNYSLHQYGSMFSLLPWCSRATAAPLQTHQPTNQPTIEPTADVIHERPLTEDVGQSHHPFDLNRLLVESFYSL